MRYIERLLPSLDVAGVRVMAFVDWAESCLQRVLGPSFFKQSGRRIIDDVPADVLDFQMRIAIREATDLGFVPPAFRAMAQSN